MAKKQTKKKNAVATVDQQFNEVISIILQHQTRALIAVNRENLLSAWTVGAYTSAKLKSNQWGSGVVNKLAEYIGAQHPELKGYSRRNIYNMIFFFDAYSTVEFKNTLLKYLPPDSPYLPGKIEDSENVKTKVQTVSAQIETIEEPEIVQTLSAQLETPESPEILQTASAQMSAEIDASEDDKNMETKVQTLSAQLETPESPEILQTVSAQLETTEGFNVEEFVQVVSAQMPKFLTLTTLSNHFEILFRCQTNEERLFYILYSHREHLTYRELRRCIANQTFVNLLGSKKHMSKALLDIYPQAPVMLKDKIFVDFLGLPQKHSEARLKKGLVQHMKEFILELGKDFLFIGQEYPIEVGGSIYKIDLLFFHRGLRALVAVELKKNKFEPGNLGQLQFYIAALDRDVKRTNENPSIGILLCPDVDNAVVEYALSNSMSPTLIAEYKRLLIPLDKMQRQLSEYCSAR